MPSCSRVCSFLCEGFVWSLIPISVGCIFLLSYYGKTVVGQYIASKDFHQGECLVVEHKSLNSTPCTYFSNCGRDCRKKVRSSFPCVQVVVRVNGSSGRYHTGILYNNFPDKNAPKCSTHYCQSKTRSAVTSFLQQWPVNRKTSCIYNPGEPEQVLVKQPYSLAVVINFLFWPLLWIAFTITTFTSAYCCECYDKAKKVKKGTSVAPTGGPPKVARSPPRASRSPGRQKPCGGPTSAVHPQSIAPTESTV